MEAGYRMHLANTAAIQQYGGLKYTNDRSDARWLAWIFAKGKGTQKILLKPARYEL